MYTGVVFPNYDTTQLVPVLIDEVLFPRNYFNVVLFIYKYI